MLEKALTRQLYFSERANELTSQLERFHLRLVPLLLMLARVLPMIRSLRLCIWASVI
jgi:hypothetical protein